MTVHLIEWHLAKADNMLESFTLDFAPLADFQRAGSLKADTLDANRLSHHAGNMIKLLAIKCIYFQ